MRRGDGSVSAPTGSRVLKLFLALLFSVGLLLPQGATGQQTQPSQKRRSLNIGVIGFLAGLPEGGLATPPSAAITARLALPAERGHVQAPLSVDITPETRVSLEDEVIQNGQFVRMKLGVQDGRLVVERIHEAAIGIFPGILASVPGGGVTLPVSTDQTVTLLVAGLPDLPLSFVITPGTDVESQGQEFEGFGRPGKGQLADQLSGQLSRPTRPVARPGGQPSGTGGQSSKPDSMASQVDFESSVLGSLIAIRPGSLTAETAPGRTLRNGDRVAVELTVLGGQLVAIEIKSRGQAPTGQQQQPQLQSVFPNTGQTTR